MRVILNGDDFSTFEITSPLPSPGLPGEGEGNYLEFNMTKETPDTFDTDLHTLFAPIHPIAGFEDRLVNALHAHRRWSIPAPIYKAAIAAAAVLVVGTTGYFGNSAITGHARLGFNNNLIESVASLLQPPLSTTPAVSAHEFYALQGQLVDKKSASDGWMNNPFVGTQHDNLNSANALGGKIQANKAAATAFDNVDSILLRHALTDDQPVAAKTPSANYFRQLLTAGNPTRSVEQKSKSLRSFDGKGNYDSFADKDTTTPHPIQSESDIATQGQASIDAPGLLPAAPPIAIDQPAPAAPLASTQPTDDRKIIRTGSMEFEVERFDAAQTQIVKIVTELGGFIGATDSQKLPNGKVRGSITVRVAPERLDTLVMSLRALGDLKNQQITAQDVTKEYTDLQSELIADRAMQDRLLELIHTGKGSVKDLLAAENELGTWRGKIEKAEGAIRYYNSQVALSTLTITLSERDIQTPAAAIETETADMGLEAEDVEKTRTSAITLIENAKGRIIEAELKRYDAGQLAGRLVADVPPESAGAVLDQLKLLGKVARLEIHRQQANGDTATTTITPIKTDRKPTRLLISIYNLANIAPRHTTNVSVAAEDVEAAYAALSDFTKTNGGRVVSSNLDRGDPIKATGTLVLEIPPDKFESAMSAIRAHGDVLYLTLVENPDVQNSTQAKQGLTITLTSLASVPPRESLQQLIAAADVSTAYQTVLAAAASAHARVQSAQLNEQDRQNITADLQLEVPRTELENFEKSLASAGGTLSRNSTRALQVDGTVDSKLALKLSITSSDHLSPRETTHLKIETADVEKSSADVQAAAIAAGGRVLESTATNDHGNGTARVAIDLPLEKTTGILQQLRTTGTITAIDSSRDPQAPAGPLAHGQIFVEFNSAQALVADQSGPWASIRQGLSTSITGLMWSLQWIVVGVCLIGPWVVVGWVGLKLWRRRATVKN